MSDLNKKCLKGILKGSSSFDGGEGVVVEEGGGGLGGRKKSAKFDEINLMETLHPENKDYGFMKIEEPKTPYYYEEGEEIEEGREIDPHELSEKIKEKCSRLPAPSFDEEEEEHSASNPQFESKRKLHYNEYFAVKLARSLMEREEEEVGEGVGGGNEDEEED